MNELVHYPSVIYFIRYFRILCFWILHLLD